MRYALLMRANKPRNSCPELPSFFSWHHSHGIFYMYIILLFIPFWNCYAILRNSAPCTASHSLCVQHWQTLFGIHLKSQNPVFQITDLEDANALVEGKCQVRPTIHVPRELLSTVACDINEVERQRKKQRRPGATHFSCPPGATIFIL